MATASSYVPTRAEARPPRPIVEDWMWQRRGRCVNLPSEVFFPEDTTRRNRRANEERAKRICRDCPVVSECREHAVRTPETYGIWGATTPRERADSIAAPQSNTLLPHQGTAQRQGPPAGLLPQ
jgi:WhiB family redox-sensing transcriptional regulator